MNALIVSDERPEARLSRESLLRRFPRCEIASIEGFEGVADEGIALALVFLSGDVERGLAVIRQIAEGLSCRIAAVGPAADPQLIIRAVRDGADDYVDEAHLGRDPDRALGHLKPLTNGTGTLITVLSAAGGSGSSTLAAGFSASLARRHRECVLLDLHLDGGDLDSLLDLSPSRTLSDLCRNLPRLDGSLFEQLLASHESGVRLLASPPSIAEAREVTTEGIARAVNLARESSPYVVVDADCSLCLNHTDLPLRADAVVVVFRFDLASLRKTRRLLDELRERGVEPDRVRLVGNRYGEAGQVPLKQAGEALGRPIAYFVPDDPKRINRANNVGLPAVIHCPRARTSRRIAGIALSLNGSS